MSDQSEAEYEHNYHMAMQAGNEDTGTAVRPVKADSGGAVAVCKAQDHPPGPALTPEEQRQVSVGKALDPAYERASELRLTPEEAKLVSAPFDDDVVEIRPHDGLIYIPHIFISERLNQVLGPGQWSMVRRREFREGNRIYAEWILKIRGCFVGESIGAQDYIPTNPKSNYSDALEGTRGEAIRRICGKDLSCGHQVWKPQYARQWVNTYAVAVWCKDNLGKKKKMWRLKTAQPIDMYPWTEIGPFGAPVALAPRQAPAPSVTRPTPSSEPINPPSDNGGVDDVPPDLGQEPEWMQDPPVEPKQANIAEGEAEEIWRQFPIPFDWGRGKPDCIHKGTPLGEIPKNKLWGIWKNYEPRPYNGKISEGDKRYRAMLDLAGDHYDFQP